MAGSVIVRLHGDLTALARSGEVVVPVDHPRSVKDAVESCGVPHTEVDVVLLNGRSVDFTARVGAGDVVTAYPPSAAVDVASRVRPPPLRDVTFLLDVHLGRLAERLRLLGFDASYATDADDRGLAESAVRDQRWLLTRDRGLLMRAVVTHGYLVRSSDPRRQTVEVVRRFELVGRIAPFTRCTHCNGHLASVAKAAVAHRLAPGTRRDHDEFVRCGGCGHLYWSGSHHTGLHRFVADVLGAAGDADPRGG